MGQAIMSVQDIGPSAVQQKSRQKVGCTDEYYDKKWITYIKQLYLQMLF